MSEGILSAIGNTPLIRLTKVMPDAPFYLYAKLEALNPGGSRKIDRLISIIQHGMETGAIHPIPSSSPAPAIWVSAWRKPVATSVCVSFCVVDPKITSLNLSLLRAYGAEIDSGSQSPIVQPASFFKLVSIESSNCFA